MTDDARTQKYPVGDVRSARPGWLPDDDLTHEWLQLVEQYRAECDATDRRRLLSETAPGEGNSSA